MSEEPSRAGERPEIDEVLRSGGRRNWARRIYWLVGVAVVALLVWWFFYPAGDAQGPVYTTDTAARGDLTVYVTATGTVQPTNTVEISSELSGTITEVLVDFNDPIEAGAILARLNTESLEATLERSQAALVEAEARVSMAETALADADAALQRATVLSERGVTSNVDLSSAQSAVDRARAELTISAADRDIAAADVRSTQAELAKACICSPIDGVVLDRAVEVGQIVAASFSAPTLFTIAEDLRQMQLQVNVDEADIGKVAVGDSAEFRVDAFTDRSFPASVVQVRYAPETVENVVTYKAILAVDNAELLLRPGMTATADITVEFIEDALLIPNAALRFRPREELDSDGGRFLFMPAPGRPPQPDQAQPAAADADPNARTIYVLRDGAPAPVSIVTGAYDGSSTVVTGGELAAGDRVIVDADYS